MSKELETTKQHNIVNIEESAMSIDKVISQITLIQHVMHKAMKKDEHYGIIPGTYKPTLLKPGAEKLCLTFRLDPDYEIIREVREKDFIAYTVKCILSHIPTGQIIASGIGSCNSREKKYRYYSKNTHKDVPKDYWKHKDPELLGGPQFLPRKNNGKWVIFEQIENDNPWDLDNTIVKMACKRALVAATLNATAASDIFTQDIEELPKELLNGESEEKPDTTVEDIVGDEPPDTTTDQTPPTSPPTNTDDESSKEFIELQQQITKLATDKEIKNFTGRKCTAIINKGLGLKESKGYPAGIDYYRQELAAIEEGG